MVYGVFDRIGARDAKKWHQQNNHQKKENKMNDPVLTYRGATTYHSDIVADHEKHDSELRDHDPILTYRGVEFHYSDVYKETKEEAVDHDPTITYRGASAHLSELHK